MNESKDAVEARLQVGKAGPHARVLFEDRSVVNGKEGFVEGFRGYEAHVYEIE